VLQQSFRSGRFSLVAYDEEEKLRGFCAEGEEDKWLIQNEFVVNFHSKYPHLLLRTGYEFDPFYIIIRNNICGRSFYFPVYVFPVFPVLQSLSHCKLPVDGPTFYNGDDVSISVLPLDPASQTRTIGVQWLHEEEGNDDDDIQSKDEFISAHNSSDDDDAHVAKVEIASHILRNY
jgi:hypothetical protein